jgi:hypothetical protein
VADLNDFELAIENLAKEKDLDKTLDGGAAKEFEQKEEEGNTAR